MNFNKCFFDKECAYLNYASTSYPKCQVALNAFSDALASLPEGPRQNRMSRSLDNFRERVGKVIGVAGESVFFTHGATLGLNQVILGFVKPGQSIAIDNRSHNAVVRPFYSLASSNDSFIANIYDEDDHLIQDNLLDIITRSPDLLCLSHVSNVNGSIYPIEKIIDFVQIHSPSTAILVDASQSAGNVVLSSLKKADFIVFPSHKHLHSLPGAAVIVAKKQLNPMIFGGTGSDSMDSKTSSIEVGTHSFPMIQALVDSLEYAESTIDEHRAMEEVLTEKLLDGVQQIEGLQLIGRKQMRERVGIIALKTESGLPEQHWAPFLSSQNIFVRGGVHCSPLHHQQLGLSKVGSLRLSLGWGSTESDVEKALKALREFSHVARRVMHVSTN